MSGRRWRAGLHRLAAVLTRTRRDAEFDEELAAHVELSSAEYRRRGLSDEEARRAALVALGGTERTRDLHRDTRGLPRLEVLLADVRYGVRSIRRSPGFSVAAVLILALGIGANTLVFTVLNGVLLRPLPFREPDRLVWIANDYPGNAAAGLSGVSSLVAMLEEWQTRAQSFEALTGYNAFFGYGSYKLAGGGEPERVAGVAVGRDLFEVLGVPMLLGRSFVPEEATQNGPRAVVLSHAIWQRRFAADPAIIGRQVVFNDRPATVVGVLPEGFDFGAVFAPGVRVDLFQPLVFDLARQSGNTLAVIARLRPGVTVEAAHAELAALVPQILRDHPGWGIGHGARVSALQTHVSGSVRTALLALGGAVAMVLLIVCANLANLMLSRGVARERELAIRAALGAGRGRLLKQLLTETFVLGSAGAILGFVFAAFGVRGLSLLPGVSIPLLPLVDLDLRAAIFTAGAAMAAVLLAGVVPALQLSRGDLHPGLKDAARGSTGARHARLRGGLVIAEVALACVLLVGAGLLLRSFERVLAVPLGFTPDHAVAIKIEPNQTIVDVARRRQFAVEAVSRAAAVPGVTAVGLTDTLPLDRDRAWGVRIPGRTFPEGEAPVAHLRMIGHRYLAAMGVRLLGGREFTEAEWLNRSDVLLVNDRMARALWPGASAIDQEVILADRRVRIVGVVDDVRHSAVEREGGFEMYLPIGWYPIRAADLIVRSELPVDRLAPMLRAALRPLDPAMPVADITPLRTLVDRAVSPRRFYTGLLSSFAGAALVLACLGIFGVISYGVTQRRTEIGIRLALGATPAAVWREIVWQTVRLAAAGVAIGAAVSFVLSRSLGSLLFGVSATDPVAFATTALVLAAAAVLAAYVPARRASRVDPAIALRAH